MEDFAKTYSQMTDGELLQLSEECDGIIPDARIALMQELYKRANESPQTNKGKSGVSVVVPRRSYGIIFPQMCPGCLRTDIVNDVNFNSLSHRHFRFTHTRHDYLSIKIPHCDQCAKIVAHRRKQSTIYMVLVAICSFGLGIWKDWNNLVPVILLLVLSLPAVWYSRVVESVDVGDYNEEFIEFCFKNSVYADAFKSVNGLTKADVAAERKSLFLEAYNQISRPR